MMMAVVVLALWRLWSREHVTLCGSKTRVFVPQGHCGNYTRICVWLRFIIVGDKTSVAQDINEMFKMMQTML